MALPISGIIQIFGFFILFLLGYRFLKYGKENNNLVGKFFGYGFLLSSFSRIFLGVPSLFFLQDRSLWAIFEIIERSFLVAGITTIGYAVFYIGFQKYAKKVFIFLFSISIAIVAGFAISPPTYNVTSEGVLVWQNPPFIPSILSFLLILIVCIPGFLFFLKEGLSADTRKVKVRSIGLALAMLWLLIPTIIDFFIIESLSLNPLYSDISYLIFFIILTITILLTYPSAQKKRY